MKKKTLLWETVLVFLLGTCLHFTYHWSGENLLVGLFSAINESVWEHTKMVILPTVLWYVVYYARHKSEVARDVYFSSMMVSLLVSIGVMPFLFYFYSGAFGVELLIVDIFIFLISIIVGEYYGNRYFNKGKTLPWIPILIVMIAVYVLFTLYQPNLPIFISAE